MRLERRANVPLYLVIVAPIVAIAIALILAAGLIAAAGVNPATAYGEMLRGAFGSRLSMTETLTRATPLILTGLAAAVAFRARLWNIGGEGQFFMGALATAWIGHSLGLPPVLGITVLLVIGMLAGAALLAGPAYLRLRFGVDEVVTTLLLNFIVILFVGLMIEGPLRDPLAFGWPSSVPVDGDFRLPDLIARTRLHIGFLIAIAAAGVVWVVLSRTVFGAETRAAGLRPSAAPLRGSRCPGTMMGVALFSGALAGLGRIDRGPGRHGERDDHDVAGLWLCGDCCGNVGCTPPRRRGRGRHLRRHRLRRRRRHEPRHRGAKFHRRRDRGAVSSDYACGAVVHNSPGAKMIEALELLTNTSLWAAVLRIATPLIFGVLGALLCERAGVLNLGIEGIMTMGAMTGWLTVYMGGDLWTGLVVAALCGAVLGLLHATLTVPLGLSQHVSGLGITLFASALVLLPLPPDRGGRQPAADDRAVPPPRRSGPVRHPRPRPHPVLNQTAPTYLALISVAVLAYVLARTPLGLAIRMTGENPHAVEAQGLNPMLVRIGAVVAGSALMAIGGAFLTTAAFNSFFPEMVQGRGWICIALVLCGLAARKGPDWRAALCLLRCLSAAPPDGDRRGPVPIVSYGPLRVVDPCPGPCRATRRSARGADGTLPARRAITGGKGSLLNPFDAEEGRFLLPEAGQVPSQETNRTDRIRKSSDV